VDGEMLVFFKKSQSLEIFRFCSKNLQTPSFSPLLRADVSVRQSKKPAAL
jgi:hypothetical protein